MDQPRTAYPVAVRVESHYAMTPGARSRQHNGVNWLQLLVRVQRRAGTYRISTVIWVDLASYRKRTVPTAVSVAESVSAESGRPRATFALPPTIRLYQGALGSG